MSRDITRTDTQRRRAACVAISGACLGFLTGLSISPVVGIVLTSVVAVLVALVSAMAGLDHVVLPAESDTAPHGHRRRLTVNPLPITLLLVGITAGAVAGIWTRTHDLLGTARSSGTIGPGGPDPRLTALYRAEASQCDDLRGMSLRRDATGDEALRQQMANEFRNDARVGRVIAGCKEDAECLRAVVAFICN